MSTWVILQRLWYFVHMPRHPLVRYEARRVPQWKGYDRLFKRSYRYALAISLGVLVIGSFMEIALPSRTSFLMLTVSLFVPVVAILLLSGLLLGMAIWQVPVAMAGSSIIVNERAARTWDLLLLTPIERSDLLLAKLAVSMSRMQSFLTLVVLLQTVPALLLLSSLSRVITGMAGGILPFVMTVVVMSLFVVDRFQQFAMAGLLGLISSLVAETWPMAAAGAVALGAVALLGRILITFTIATVLSGGKVLDVIPVVLVGPPIVATSSSSPMVGIGVLLLLLLAQEGTIRVMMRWMTRYTSR